MRPDKFALLASVCLAVFLREAGVHAQTADGLPPGHPTTTGTAAPGGGMFVPPEDEEREDASQPPGTITVDLRDADGLPIPRETVLLGVLVNSVAKGESRRHEQAVADANGRAVFTGLELASNIAYRVSVGYQGGLFAATPFQLSQAKAMHVVLHLYPVTHDIRLARVVADTALAAEVRDDRIQIEQVLTIYNLGRVAWQPDDVTMALPEAFTAFNSQATMSDQGTDVVGGNVRLRGTFAPGKGAVDWRWQLPWSGEANVDFTVGLPPHVAIARVMMPAGGDIGLSVQGFPATEVRRDAQGRGFVVTERHLRPDEPRLTALAVGIHGLPEAGWGRWVAIALAACGVIVGFALSMRQARSLPEGELRESALLEELAALERAHATGEVGPRTYERARRELIDGLARVLATRQA
jgi:hypothetical protein